MKEFDDDMISFDNGMICFDMIRFDDDMKIFHDDMILFENAMIWYDMFWWWYDMLWYASFDMCLSFSDAWVLVNTYLRQHSSGKQCCWGKRRWLMGWWILVPRHLVIDINRWNHQHVGVCLKMLCIPIWSHGRPVFSDGKLMGFWPRVILGGSYCQTGHDTYPLVISHSYGKLSFHAI